MAIGIFRSNTRIVHGIGSSYKAGKEAKQLGMDKVLIITDPIIRKAGCTKEIEISLKEEGIPYLVHDQVSVDPGIEQVELGVQLVQKEGITGLIAVGGGSVLCCAKGVALLLNNPGDLRDYEGRYKASAPLFPLIALPTTAGSGAEVSPNFLISDHERHWKMTLFGDYYPAVAILDPLLLRTLPSGPAMNASLDALTHAIEAYLSNQASMISDSLALHSAAKIYENIIASSLTDDMDAKYAVLVSSAMANMACGNAGLGLVHGVTYGMPDLEHGYACGIMLPFVMEYNRPACVDRMAQLAVAFGSEAKGKSNEELSFEAIHRVKELYKKLSFPDRLPENKISRSQLFEIVNGTLNAPTIPLNIRQPTRPEMEQLIESAFEGWNALAGS